MSTPVRHDVAAAAGLAGPWGEQVLRHDWAAHPLGPIERWPGWMRTSVATALASRFPIVLWFTDDLWIVYNEAYIPILGEKHPASLGAAGRVVWSEIWDVIAPPLHAVLDTGTASWFDDMRLDIVRRGALGEGYFTFTYSPIFTEDGGVGGVFCAVHETTARILAERRLRTLRELGVRLAGVRTARRCFETAMDVFASTAPDDLPLTALYFPDQPGDAPALRQATAALEPLLGRTAPTAEAWGVDGAAGATAEVDLRPLAALAEAELGVALGDVGVLARIAAPDGQTGYLLAGAGRRRRVDAEYRGFVELVAGQIATALASASAFEAEVRRAEALSELDRAKTAFFGNVSHEFRTPLTLMLGPLEGLLERSPPVEGDVHGQLEVIHRNARRLLRLVNSLLDFSRVQEARMDARYERIDLAAFTQELASVFRSAAQRAGLDLVVDCPPLDTPVYVDPEMWETIVSNLLSNAIKFTLEGSITVRLRGDADGIRLTVSDTGVGVPKDEIPRLFERFHRVRGSRGRTHEGTGIGLALVHDLVSVHGGSIGVTSGVGTGTAFTVTLPAGSGHLPENRIASGTGAQRAPEAARFFADEALGWSAGGPAGEGAEVPPATAADAQGAERSDDRGRVLVVDDNTDMRAYIGRLLATEHDVEAYGDGQAALSAALAHPPDLVLTDVMMPRLDGFELVEALRRDPRTSHLPILLLSARSGEESTVEGLASGADDYLVKPFTAGELRARVRTHLELARARRRVAALWEQSARRQAFLLTLTAAMRPFLEPDEIMAAAASALADELGADGVLFLDVVDGVHGSVVHEHARDGTASPRTFLLDQFGREPIGALRRGEAVAISDAASDPRLEPAEREALSAAAVGAAIAVPRVRGGRWIAAVGVRSRTPRRWSDDELALLEEAAQRTWAALELATAEQSARLSRERRAAAEREFVANAAHELRTPLTGIVTAVEALMAGAKDDPAARERFLTHLQREADRLSRLNDSLLLLAQVDSPSVVPEDRVPIRGVLEDAVDDLDARPGVEVVVEAPADLTIVTNRGLLERIMLNLCANSAMHTRTGTIWLRAKRSNGAVTVEVEDTGSGIPTEIADQAFERFSRGARTPDGFGLGLSIVRQAADVLGGEVALRPRPGGGTIATLRLPQKPPAGRRAVGTGSGSRD